MAREGGFFSKKVDLRSRKAMIDFLLSHERYAVDNHGARHSYAHCVKVYRLGLSSDVERRVYDLLDCEGALDFIDRHISRFTYQNKCTFTACFNGRQSGYLVLYRSYYEKSQHRTRCRACGQLNFRDVLDTTGMSEAEAAIATYRVQHGTGSNCLQDPDVQKAPGTLEEKQALIQKWSYSRCEWLTVGNRCGRCGVDGPQGRHPHSGGNLRIAGAVDQNEHAEGYEQVSTEDLREKVRLVQKFDALCEKIRKELIKVASNYDVVEKPITRKVRTTVRVLRRVEASATA